MPKIDKVRVDNVDYDIVSGDNLPVGTEVDFDGQSSDIPVGWEQVEDKGEVYSTTETRVGTWTDGKPLYRKVVALSSLNQTISITDFNLIDKIIDYEVVFKVYSNNFIFKLPDINGAYNTQTIGYFTNGTFVVQSRRELASGDFKYGYLIYKYTKTTDTVQGGNS